MKAELAYIRNDIAYGLVTNYICDLKSREPPCKESSKPEYYEWSSAKSAAETILERILDGFDPVVVVEDYAAQMDYFSEIASEAGNYDTSMMFAIGSDVATDLLQLFYKYDIYYEEDYYNEQRYYISNG